MATFKKGDVVKLNGVVPQGPVLAMRMDEDGNVCPKNVDYPNQMAYFFQITHAKYDYRTLILLTPLAYYKDNLCAHKTRCYLLKNL